MFNVLFNVLMYVTGREIFKMENSKTSKEIC